MSASGAGRDGLLTEINVTPLVDVVLVLLVLMMVTATAIANKTITIELPKASAGTAAHQEEPLVVGVDERGALFLGEVSANDAEVRERARAVAAKKEQGAVIAADGRARHEAVVHALDLLRGEHITKVSIVVRGDGR